MFIELRLILLSITLLFATGNGDFVYVVLAAFGWYYIRLAYIVLKWIEEG